MVRVKGKARKCGPVQTGAGQSAMADFRGRPTDRHVFTGFVVPLSVGREAEQLVSVAWQRDWERVAASFRGKKECLGSVSPSERWGVLSYSSSAWKTWSLHTDSSCYEYRVRNLCARAHSL